MNKEQFKDAWQRISFVLKSQSFRQALHKYYGLSDMPDETVGWTSVFMKHAFPDIEIYIDEMAKALASYLKETGQLTEELFMEYMMVNLNLTLIHELIHFTLNEDDETTVEMATLALFRDAWMTWTTIRCPKVGTDVTWVECLRCTDNEKHPSCPLQKIRKSMVPRQYEEGIYHVTELCHPRYSYYERLHGYSKSLDDMWDLFFGRAVGAFIESLYEEGRQEVELEAKFTRDGETITVTGHADLIHTDAGWLIELKTYATLKYVLKKGKPSDEHIFQTQAYYTIGTFYDERYKHIFEKLKKLKVIMLSRTRGKRYKEFPVKMKRINLELPAFELHTALKTKTPPKTWCPLWLCRYCANKHRCDADKERGL